MDDAKQQRQQLRRKRTKIYAIVAAVSIGILAAGAIGGLWTGAPVATLLPAANGNEGLDKVSEERGFAPTSPPLPTTTVAAFDREPGGNSSFELFVTGSASRKISPDQVSVTLGVETQEKTAQEAASKNAQTMNAIIEGLKQLGLETSQISTNFYNIYPVYEYEAVPLYEERYVQPPHPQKQVLVGYRVTNTITATAPAGANVGEIIDTAINAGANQVQGVGYFVSEEVQREMNEDLIGEAVLNAKMKAEKALAPLGMKIVGVKNLNLNDIYYPFHGYDKVAFAGESAAAAVPTPILPSEQRVSTSVSVSFMIAVK